MENVHFHHTCYPSPGPVGVAEILLREGGADANLRPGAWLPTVCGHHPAAEEGGMWEGVQVSVSAYYSPYCTAYLRCLCAFVRPP